MKRGRKNIKKVGNTKDVANLPLMLGLAGSLVALALLFVIDTTVEPATFPEFELEDGLTSQSVTKEAMMGEAWVAYFSATWCTHCHPTLDSIDLVIPDDRLLVFNTEATDSDMIGWNEDMEEYLERDLDRPFIHAPGLAAEVEVLGRPYLIFIDAEGNIQSDRVGLWTDADEMAETWEETLSA
jgi:hypothetical protein